MDRVVASSQRLHPMQVMTKHDHGDHSHDEHAHDDHAHDEQNHAGTFGKHIAGTHHSAVA